MAEHLHITTALVPGGNFDLNEILGTAMTTVTALLDAIDADAVSDVSYKEPWLMLSPTKFVLGEKEDIFALECGDHVCERVPLDWWDKTPARDISATVAKDKDGEIFNRLLALAISLRARDDLGDGEGRMEAFEETLGAFKDVAFFDAFDWRVDPYALLKSRDLDLGDPENREAAEIVEGANVIVSEFYQDLVQSALQGIEYDDAFVLLSFDKATVGTPPEVGERHLDASASGKVGKMMLFPEPISAKAVLRAFQYDEFEIRVHLVTALIDLRQLHERGPNRLVERDLDAQIASLKAKLWYALKVS